MKKRPHQNVTAMISFLPGMEALIGHQSSFQIFFMDLGLAVVVVVVITWN